VKERKDLLAPIMPPALRLAWGLALFIPVAFTEGWPFLAAASAARAAARTIDMNAIPAPSLRPRTFAVPARSGGTTPSSFAGS